MQEVLGFFLERKTFKERMDDDLAVKRAFDNVTALVSDMDIRNLTPDTVSGVIKAFMKVNEVFQLFSNKSFC